MSHIPKLLLLLIILIFSFAESESSPDLVSELRSLQSRSKSGVIRLTDDSVSRFLASTSRRFSLVIFFDAAKLHGNPNLHLTELHREFSLLSSSLIANNLNASSSSSNPNPSALFFCDIEFHDSESTFKLFGVKSLPHIRVVGSGQTENESHQMDPSDFAGLPESMSDFIESKTSIVIGPIRRPPLLSRSQIILAGIISLVSLPFLVKKILTGETFLHKPRVWLSGAVFVYFFSVSGTMYSIIRRMPMFLVDRDDPSKMILFYKGSGMQLGAEGFAVGFLYTVVGLVLAFVSKVLVNVRDVNVQRGVLIAALLVSFGAVKKVVVLDYWKTGYIINFFLPLSWQ